MKSFAHKLNAFALILKLLIPLRVLRWLLGLLLVLWVSGLALRDSNLWDLILSFAIGSSGLLAYLLLMLIPNQVVALASNRPVSLLGDSRAFFLWFLLITTAVISGMFYLFLTIKPYEQSLFTLVLVIWLVVSLLVQMCVFIRSRWENNWFLVFVVAWLWMKLGFWLLELHSLLLASVLVVSWLVFARWWLRWQPKKYQPNILTAAINHEQQLAASRNSGIYLPSGKAKTWLGSRLYGAPDSWRSRSYGLLIGGGIFLLVPWVASLFVGQQAIQKLIHYALLALLMYFVGLTAQGISNSLVINLRRIWLVSSGDRQQLLTLAGKLYTRELGMNLILCLSLAIVTELMWSEWRGLWGWLFGAVTILLLCAANFYLAWWVYLRRQGSLLWCNWVLGMHLFVCMGLACASGLLASLPFEWQGISPLWLWGSELAIIVVLHKKVRAGFFNMDLLRVA